ncbi:MAG: aminoacyl-tRNA hydrolase [Candidatus Berkelbacteria bacterium]|nr:aminoacyl-tRNA hydrolase [Candidatus Berkelbacteria bacterium]
MIEEKMIEEKNIKVRPSVRRLIVGLGNPGKRYEKTRHNVGFLVIDRLNQSSIINHQSSILFKPQSFMNLSGQEVAKKVNYYHIKPKDLIIIHDDIDLPFGEIRVKDKGSSAGHKGVQSIIDELETKSFTRVRIGVERPPENIQAEKYVLENFNKQEELVLQKVIDEAVEKVIGLIGVKK